MIQDEHALLEPIDHEVMARIYQWQAMAADPYLDPSYRAHYKRRLQAVRDELTIIIEEVIRAETAILKDEAFLKEEDERAKQG